MIFVLWMINSFFLYLAGALFRDFHVASFATAMLGALFISAAQFCLNAIFGIPRRPIRVSGAGTPPPAAREAPRSRRHREDDEDAIDI